MQRSLPTLLKPGCNQTIVGIAGAVAAFGETGLVTGPLQFRIEDLALIFLSLAAHPLRLECGLDRQEFYRARIVVFNAVTPSLAKEERQSVEIILV